jgi:hypothetical protein
VTVPSPDSSARYSRDDDSEQLRGAAIPKPETHSIMAHHRGVYGQKRHAGNRSQAGDAHAATSAACGRWCHTFSHLFEQ